MLRTWLRVQIIGPEGWFEVVYNEGTHEAVYAELSANEQSAYRLL